MLTLTNTHVDLHRFEDQVRDLEADLQAHPPEPGGILFYGSSTTVHWRADNLLQRQMAPLQAISTGFGGSTADEALYYYGRLVVPAQPAVLVYYEGDNDLGLGYTADQVLEITHRLFEWARRDLPGISFVIIPVKDYPAQDAPKDQLEALNRSFADYARELDDTWVADIGPVLLNKDGRTREDIFEQDNTHFNPKGYELLAAQVKPLVARLAQN